MNEKLYSCEDVEECLTDYIDGTLESCTVTSCENHFNTCSGCKSNLAIISGIVSNLSQIKEEDVPVEFSENVSIAIDSTLINEKVSFTSDSVFEQIFQTLKPVFLVLPLLLICFFAGYSVISLSNTTHEQFPIVADAASRFGSSMSLSGGVVIVDGLKIEINDSSDVAVESGQTIAHFPGADTTKLILGDGSSVALSHRATVSVIEDRLVIEKGRLDLTMAPTGVGFVVRTPHADVIVRGTVYSIEVGKATRVVVSSGSVLVESLSGNESVILKKGDRVSVLSTGKIKKIINDSVDTTVIPTVVPSGDAENTNISTNDSN